MWRWTNSLQTIACTVAGLLLVVTTSSSAAIAVGLALAVTGATLPWLRSSPRPLQPGGLLPAVWLLAGFAGNLADRGLAALGLLAIGLALTSLSWRTARRSAKSLGPEIEPEDVLAAVGVASLAMALVASRTLAIGLLLALALAVVPAAVGGRRGGLALLLAAAANLLPTAGARRTRWLVQESRPGLGMIAFGALNELHRQGALPAWSQVAARRLHCRQLLDSGYLAVRAGLPWHGMEAAWVQAAAAVDTAGTDRGLLIESLGQAADLAYRSGRYAETVALADRLIAETGDLLVADPTSRLLVHIRLLRIMALAAVGETMAAEADLTAKRQALVAGPDAATLRVLAAATIRLARRDPADIVSTLRRGLTWADREVDPAAAWWRTYAHILGGEAALQRGDAWTAETYALGAVLATGPSCPQAALLLARARDARGEHDQAAEARAWAAAHGGDGPFAQEARLALNQPPTDAGQPSQA